MKMKLSFLLFSKYLANALLITALSGCNPASYPSEVNRSFSPDIQKDLLSLHHLQTYRAGKNSFVLGLETICNRPAMLDEYGRKTILNLMYAYGHVMNNLGGSHHMGYYARAIMASTHIESDQIMEARLQLSYDDQLKVCLNGHLIHSDNKIHNGYITREFEIELKAGQNRLLVKLLDTPNVNTIWAGIGMRILN